MSTIEEPIKLAHLTCRNRVIRSAVHSFLGSAEGYMTDDEYNMYETLAKNHVGTIITGHCCVAEGGRANPEQINIYSDEFIPQFEKFAQLLKKYDTRSIVQISHAGPRAIDTEDLKDVCEIELKKDKHARELTVEEIHEIRDAFIAAAKRLKDSGVDGIQLHAAHSYLLSRFLDPTFNHRTDEYGGSVENRFRIVEEIIKGIHESCGEDFPVLVKINNDTNADDEAYEKDLLWMLNRMKELKVELVELSGVDFINQPKKAVLYYLDRAAAMRRAVNMPMSLVGGARSLADMEKVLASGIDMVSLGRPLIAEPDFINKSLEGQEKSSCVNCCRCFVLPHMTPGVRCVIQWKKIKAEQKKAEKAISEKQ